MDEFLKFSHQYGKLFTIWFGSQPVVFVNDCDIGKDVFNRDEYSNRVDRHIAEEISFMLSSKVKTIGFIDYCEEVRQLRKNSFEALRFALLEVHINPILI